MMYDVIIKSLKTGEENIVGTVVADTLVKARNTAVREWMGKWNMIWQQLLVRKQGGQ